MEILTFLCGTFWRNSAISYDAIFQDAQQDTLQRERETVLSFMFTARSAWAFLLSKLATLVIKVWVPSEIRVLQKQSHQLKEGGSAQDKHWQFRREGRGLSNSRKIWLKHIVCGCRCSVSYLRAIRCISTTRQARAQRSQRSENRVLPKARCFEG